MTNVIDVCKFCRLPIEDETSGFCNEDCWNAWLDKNKDKHHQEQREQIYIRPKDTTSQDQVIDALVKWGLTCKANFDAKQEPPCLVEQFFVRQQDLPPNQRSTCMISCPCSKCSPDSL